MDRKSFLRKSLMAGVLASTTPSILKASKVKLRNSDYDKLMAQVGFNPENSLEFSACG